MKQPDLGSRGLEVGGLYVEAIRALGIRVALQHCPRLGPPKSYSCGVRGGKAHSQLLL